jgi:hypothetical protein
LQLFERVHEQVTCSDHDLVPGIAFANTGNGGRREPRQNVEEVAFHDRTDWEVPCCDELSRSRHLLTHYHANITKRINANHVDRAYGYCSRQDCAPEIVEYEAGTLVLDIVDARSNRLIWRGWATNSVEDMLNDPDRMAKTIERAVSEMLRRLPPKL